MAMSYSRGDAGESTEIPTAAALLGAAGLIPFVGLAAAAHFAGDVDAAIAVEALRAYGAIILSFLGGIIWGLGIAGFGGAAAKPREALRLTVSMMPSLFGWLALLMPVESGIWLLSSCFPMVLAVDLMMVNGGLAPRWYFALRWRLTAIAFLCLVAIGATLPTA